MRNVALLFLIAPLVVSGCTNLDLVDGGARPSPSISGQVASETQYSKIGEQQIALEFDPGVLTLEEVGQGGGLDRAREILRPLGVTVESGGGFFSSMNHRLLCYSNGVRQAVLSALRASPALNFVAPGYRYPGTRVTVRLLNRFDIKFRNDLRRSVIDSFISAHGLRILRPPLPDSGFFAYRFAYPRGVDPLDFVPSFEDCDSCVVRECCAARRGTDPTGQGALASGPGT